MSCIFFLSFLFPSFGLALARLRVELDCIERVRDASKLARSRARRDAWQRQVPFMVDVVDDAGNSAGTTAEGADGADRAGAQDRSEAPATNKRRAMVWQREEAAPVAEAPPAKRQAPSAKQASDVAAATSQEERARKLAELRRKIEEAERRVKEKRVQEEESLEHEERQLREEQRRKEDRKKKFEASFADAFESARKQFAEDLASKKTHVVFADDREISRILSAKSDYAVLKLAPGASGAELRKRYREMCLSTHPDKNKHPRAMEVFRKVVSSYKSLDKYIS